MSNWIPQFYVDAITYPCPNSNFGLANFCVSEKGPGAQNIGLRMDNGVAIVCAIIMTK